MKKSKIKKKIVQMCRVCTAVPRYCSSTKFSTTVALTESASRKKYLSPDPESWCKRQVCSRASKWAIERGSY